MRSRLRVLLVCAVSMFAWSSVEMLAAPPAQRSYSAGNFILELDGVQMGVINAVEGGLPFSDVIKEPPGEEVFFKKHIGQPGVRDIRFEIGPGMNKMVYSLISDTLQGKASPVSGAVLNVDFRGTIVSRLEFYGALITEMTIPAADANSKDPVRILIGLTPVQTSLNRSPGGSAKVGLARTKNALAGSFKLSIDGLITTRVSKVEALTIKFPFRTSGDAECLHCEGIPAPDPIDFPNVIMTLSQTQAESVEQWFQSFVMNGENDDAKEKAGTLQFMTPDMQTPLFTIKFNHLGIFELTPIVEGSIARLVASMYCESMEFTGQ